MYFVLKQEAFFDKIIERNLRVGGLKSMEAACSLANREGPCFIRDHTRAIIGQNINPKLPMYIGVKIGNV